MSKKVVDLLDQDKELSGQKFVCLSFVSPEKILKQKNEFFFQEFVSQYEFLKNVQTYEKFVNFLSYKYELNTESVLNDFQEFVKGERAELQKQSVTEEYRTFMDNKEDDLQKQFDDENNFQTNVRGLKIRGSFSTQKEAELRCKMLREQDPNHDIFVGPVGTWIPWDPEAYKTGRVEHMQEDLNQLVNEKAKNEARAKQEFDDRVKEAKKNAIAENIEKAKESGNKLTQTIDKEGNLVNIAGAPGNLSNEEMSVDEIRKELFEGGVRPDNGRDGAAASARALTEQSQQA